MVQKFMQVLWLGVALSGEDVVYEKSMTRARKRELDGAVMTMGSEYNIYLLTQRKKEGVTLDPYPPFLQGNQGS